MWQLYESLNVLPEPKREAFVDRVLAMAQDLGASRDGRAILEVLGLLLRHGPQSRRGALVDRLARPLGNEGTYAFERAGAMTALAGALPLLAEAEQEPTADRIIEEARGRGKGQPVRGVYPEAVVEALRALWDHVPSRRNEVLDVALDAVARGIYDLQCLALNFLVEVADSLDPSRFDTLVGRAAEMTQSPNENARSAGRTALDRLSESGPEDRRTFVRSRREEAATTPEALLDMPLRELATHFASVPEGEREALYDSLADRAHDFVWSTHDPWTYEPSLDKHPREYEQEERALLSRLFAIAPESRRPAALERLFASLLGPMGKDEREAIARIVRALPPEVAADVPDEWSDVGTLLDALGRAGPAVAASLRESCRALLETGEDETGLGLVLGAGMIVLLGDLDDLPLARRKLEEAVRRSQSAGAPDPWDAHEQGILHGAELLLDHVLWELGRTGAAN